MPIRRILCTARAGGLAVWAVIARCSFGGLPPKSYNDAAHIAIATVYGCDIVLSWNFRHIVNLRAIKVVEAVNIREGYNVVRIMSPAMMLNEEE
jgi:hypothetical protein